MGASGKIINDAESVLGRRAARWQWTVGFGRYNSPAKISVALSVLSGALHELCNNTPRDETNNLR